MELIVKCQCTVSPQRSPSFRTPEGAVRRDEWTTTRWWHPMNDVQRFIDTPPQKNYAFFPPFLDEASLLLSQLLMHYWKARFGSSGDPPGSQMKSEGRRGWRRDRCIHLPERGRELKSSLWRAAISLFEKWSGSPTVFLLVPAESVPVWVHTADRCLLIMHAFIHF